MKSKEAENEIKPGFFSVLKFSHLTWAVVAQFFYVGAQVCVTSFFIRIAQKEAGLDEKTAAFYLTAYGFLFMAGRFSGTFFLKFIKESTRKNTVIVAPTGVAAINAGGKSLAGKGFGNRTAGGVSRTDDQRSLCHAFSSVHCSGCWCFRAKSRTWLTLVSATS